LAAIFLWIEQEQAALVEHARSDLCARDMALHQFLRLLQWLCQVLLQDAALLYSDYPNCPLFHFPPFSTLVFHTFAANSKATITHTEEAA